MLICELVLDGWLHALRLDSVSYVRRYFRSSTLILYKCEGPSLTNGSTNIGVRSMASGVEFAAGAAQIISLAFQVFQGCVDAYKFCHSAQLIGPDGDLLRTKLQIERCRLEEWAECSRLNTSSPDARLNWPLVHGILEQQLTILTSAEKLQAKYGLSLPVARSVGGGEKDEGEEGTEIKTTSGLDRVLRVLRPKLYTTTTTSSSSRAIAAANGPLKRLQWAAAGKERVVRVIDDLGDLNTQLERLLDLRDRTWLKSGMHALLRDTLSHTTDMADVEILQALLRPASGVGDAAIQAAAEFKRIRLFLGVDQRTDEIRPPRTTALRDSMPRLEMLKEKRLKIAGSSPLGQHRIQMATYKDELVLVEWRQTSQSRYSVLMKQMQSLALLLGCVDNTFARLPCRGLTASEENCRFALVYAIPEALDNTAQEPHSVEPRRLYELIESQRHVSLRQRITIAATLADAVLQLHTAGWLHKSIRSENVIFLGHTKEDSESFLADKPYLTGYDYARPESEISLTELPDAPLHTDLYRHPEKRGAEATGYRKRFDLFALGCVLTELALWEHLVSILSRLTKEDWSRAVAEAERDKKDLKLPSLLDVMWNPAFTNELAHAVGPHYLEAVQLCLTGRAVEDRDGDISLDVQREVAEKLRQSVV